MPIPARPAGPKPSPRGEALPRDAELECERLEMFFFECMSDLVSRLFLM